MGMYGSRLQYMKRIPVSRLRLQNWLHLVVS